MGPIVFSVTSTKGGVGKTTLAANLGALLAQFGMRTLLVDADIQPSLSKFFPLRHRAAHGLQAVVTRGGVIQPDSISHTNRPNLDIVISDTQDGTLQAWLKDREDRLVIMRRAVGGPFVSQHYDAVVIDTQGAVGELQKTAAMAANIMISPVNPTILSAREFAAGTMAMLESLNRLADFAGDLCSGDLYALIYNMDRSTDARLIAEQIRHDFRSTRRVRVLDTIVPSSVSYRRSATDGEPAYMNDRPSAEKKNNAYDTLHALVWELFPNLRDVHYDDIAADPADSHGERP